MTVAYIAHPISGDVEVNIKKLVEIARKINLEEPAVVPFIPYLFDLHALRDDVKEERARGIKNSIELFKRGIIDEVRLYGNRISEGMRAEITLAEGLDIRIVPMTDETIKQYYKKIEL